MYSYNVNHYQVATRLLCTLIYFIIAIIMLYLIVIGYLW